MFDFIYFFKFIVASELFSEWNIPIILILYFQFILAALGDKADAGITLATLHFLPYLWMGPIS